MRIIFLILSFIFLHVQYVFAENNKDYVVVLHGIARTNAHTKPVANFLEQQGYEVLNINYPSTKYNLQTLAKMIADDMQKGIKDKDAKVHLVGYSMGGLLTRIIVHKYSPKNLGRIVQLAPPNHGSESADLLKDTWLYKEKYGPAGQQLTTNQSKIEYLFGEVDYELGIIAGNSTIDPISSAMIPGDDDGRVSVKSTKLKGMKDHIIISASHTYFPDNKKVQKQTAYFLKHGKFWRKK
jgi:pimeloyl-ACP methyl ester carboxylesterase